MDTQSIESVKRLLIRLDDARMEVQSISNKVEYPKTSMLERVIDALETAERYLRESID